jgi:hypothetical protein
MLLPQPVDNRSASFHLCLEPSAWHLTVAFPVSIGLDGPCSSGIRDYRHEGLQSGEIRYRKESARLSICTLYHPLGILFRAVGGAALLPDRARSPARVPLSPQSKTTGSRHSTLTLSLIPFHSADLRLKGNILPPNLFPSVSDTVLFHSFRTPTRTSSPLPQSCRPPRRS